MSHDRFSPREHQTPASSVRSENGGASAPSLPFSGHDLPEQAGSPLPENRLGREAVLPLVFKMSLPMMFSMLIQALYNIVDSIFVSRISEDALTAVSLAFPVQNLSIAVGVGTAVGINALLARALGAGQRKKVSAVASMGYLLLALSALVFMLVFGLGAELYYSFQTQDPAVSSLGISYLKIVSWGSLGFFIQVGCEKLLSATGRTVLSMLTQVLGAGINILLDPLFIFGWLGFPRMGVAGAAVATILGQFAAALFGIRLNRRKNPEVQIDYRALSAMRSSERRLLLREIYEIALPSILMSGIGSVMTYSLNQILLAFSKTAAAVFGVYFRLQSFVFMPIFGLNYGLIPIISFNYGARKAERIRRALRVGMVTAIAYALFCCLCFFFFPGELLSVFDAGEGMRRIGIPALRILCVGYPLAAFSAIVIAVTQALNRSLFALWISVLRQLVALLPLAYFFSRLGGLTLLWWAFPAAEIFAFVCAFFFLQKTLRQRVADMAGRLGGA